MVAKIVGLSDVFTFTDKKTGQSRQARNIFIVRKPSAREKGYVGMVCQSLFVADNMVNIVTTFDPKKDYRFEYDNRGFLCDIIEGD